MTSPTTVAILRWRAVTAQAVIVHGVQNTAVDRLQTITDVWQGPVDDDAHRIAQVAVFHDVFDGAALDCA